MRILSKGQPTTCRRAARGGGARADRSAARFSCRGCGARRAKRGVRAFAVRYGARDDFTGEPGSEETTPLGDLVADMRATDPFESVIHRKDRDELLAMLRLLPERYREVLVRRYALMMGAPSATRDWRVARGGGERSRQIEREGLHRLRSIAATAASVSPEPN